MLDVLTAASVFVLISLSIYVEGTSLFVSLINSLDSSVS